MIHTYVLALASCVCTVSTAQCAERGTSFKTHSVGSHSCAVHGNTTGDKRYSREMTRVLGISISLHTAVYMTAEVMISSRNPVLSLQAD